MDMMSYLMGRNSGSAKKGAKIEVVTELPETGEANVIYLVPKQDEDENNVFDEYLYVNDEWELIGTTDIDLSGYQPLLTAGNNITIDNNNVISASGGSDIPIYFVEHDNTITNTSNNNSLKARLTEVVNDAYSKGYHSFNILLEVRMFANSTWRRTTLMTSMGDGVNDLQLKPTSYTLYTPFYGKTGNLNDLHLNGIRINISWDGDVATVTGVSNSSSDGSVAMTNNVLTKTNTTSFIPTQPYHPSTKKYVDDAVAAGGGSDLPIYVLNTTNELNDDKSTQFFGDDEKTQMSTILTDAYAKGYNNIAILLCSTTSARTYMFYSYSTLNNSNGYRFFYTDVTFKNRTDRTKIFWRYFNVDSTWSNNVCTATSIGYNMIDIQYLAKDNYQPYTVTGDYNPAHKLYVDTKVLTTAGLSVYSTSTTYQEGDYVYKSATDLTIYKCNTADTTGTWDSTKWTQATYMQYLSDTLVGGALNGSY